MTRTRWLIAGSWLLLFWLLAGTVWAPAIQRALAQSGSAFFSAEDHSYPPITVSFEGQEAILSGKVRHPAERAEAEKRAREKITASLGLAAHLGSDLNPVTGVTNQIEVVPYPSGWLMLAAQGKYAQLSGTAATDFEARDAVARVQERWAAQGGRMEGRVETASARFDEAPDAEKTLSSVPAPRAAGGDSAQIQIARLGNDWQRLTLDAPDEQLHQQTLALGLDEVEWEQHILPGIQTTRKHLRAERAREAEIERQAKLPPPHVLLAARDHRVLVKGETATLAIKRELLNGIIAALPDWKVLDDLRVNSQRRSVNDFGPISSLLLPQGKPDENAKALSLGLSGQGWQTVDWQVGAETLPWPELLPKDLPAELVIPDAKIVSEWLQGNAKGIPSLPLRAQPSFLTLTLLPDRVILAGQLAEESLRTQLIEAAQQTYGGRAIVMAEGLLARGTCEPTADIQQTARSLPPLPAAQGSPVVAFAKPGQVWKAQSATQELLKAGAIAKSGLLPEDFPAAMAEDTFADAFDHVRDFWQKQNANLPAASGSH